MKVMIVACLCTFLFWQCDQKKEKPNLKKDSFHLFTNQEVLDEIRNSRARKIEFSTNTKLYFGVREYKIDKINTRGLSTLDYDRKNYSINIDGKFKIYNPLTNDTLSVKKFDLSSMSMDYTYVENKISHGLLKEIDLWPLYSFYTELIINNQHQGLYLFMEDLKEHVFKKKGAKCILRRGYDHRISQIYTKDFNDLKHKIKRGYNRLIAPKIDLPKLSLSYDPYLDRFNNIYQLIKIYQGEQLHDSLSSILNLENYMKKIAADEILENGDYTDEVFFYSKSESNQKIYFDIIPWDYDDIFNSQPHEIGRTDFLCGTSFGQRIYPTYESFLKATNGRLLFSIEDDLDYIIMKDDYLYLKYLENLEKVLEKIDSPFIENLFDQVNKEISPFYQINDVIEQSAYDEKKTDLSLLALNFDENKSRIIKRLNWLKSEANSQKQILLKKINREPVLVTIFP